MRALLDTNILLWCLAHPERLDRQTRATIVSPDNEVFFSAASIREIAIKARLGRADFSERPKEIAAEAHSVGFIELPVTAAVAALVADLLMHRRDPFDRLFIAQALAGPMRFYTADKALVAYSEIVTLVG
jgi:PIN domain nuclease of toxin-antitoxin system